MLSLIPTGIAVANGIVDGVIRGPFKEADLQAITAGLERRALADLYDGAMFAGAVTLSLFGKNPPSVDAITYSSAALLASGIVSFL